MKNLKSIRIKKKFKIPQSVLISLRKIKDSGYTSWLAGGCVRDSLLGRAPKDWDIVTDAPFSVLKSIFPQHLEVGVAFGILKLPHEPIDVAIFRKDGSYSDHRHPDSIEPGSIESDMKRRDFTVNALYLDPDSHTVFDGVDGIQDLKKGLLRTVGDPSERFSEDALRILRAARFSCQLQFKINRDTLRAMSQLSPMLNHISRERIRDEVVRALGTTDPIQFLKICKNSKLWKTVFGTIAPPKNLFISSEKRWLKCSKSVQKEATHLWWISLIYRDSKLENLANSLRLTREEIRWLRTRSAVLDAFTKKKSTLLPKEAIQFISTNSKYFQFYVALTSSKALRNKVQLGLKKAQLKANAEWPQAQHFIAQGIVPGPRLGKIINSESWKLFWDL